MRKVCNTRQKFLILRVNSRPLVHAPGEANHGWYLAGLGILCSPCPERDSYCALSRLLVLDYGPIQLAMYRDDLAYLGPITHQIDMGGPGRINTVMQESAH